MSSYTEALSITPTQREEFRATFGEVNTVDLDACSWHELTFLFGRLATVPHHERSNAADVRPRVALILPVLHAIIRHNYSKTEIGSEWLASAVLALPLMLIHLDGGAQ